MFSELSTRDRFSIVKGLLYATLGIACIYLIVTGRYLNYVAPRYELLLALSGIALILGGIVTVAWALNAGTNTIGVLLYLSSFL
nr:DUF1980 domain-containing protein [Veillonella denticariosi]